MSSLGYAIIAVAMVLFVQAKTVYPDLLLGRLLFSIGGSAVSTMVTAILPVVTEVKETTKAYRESVSSELTITPNRLLSHDGPEAALDDTASPPSSRLAGFVGTCTGCGALVSLAFFLRLPTWFEGMGLSPAQAIQRSYYAVGAVALIVSFWCFIGFRNLPGDENKSLTLLISNVSHNSSRIIAEDGEQDMTSQLSYWKQISTAAVLGFRNREIGLGYVGGFVARASSVGISLFIPLFVNHYYRESGLCDETAGRTADSNLGDIKRSCPKAYVLASILTGSSQLVALIVAPAFGYLSERSRRYHLPLLFAAFAGIAGYLSFALLPSPQFNGPDGNSGVFVVIALIGLSQIGAIVCSLAVLNNGIHSMSSDVALLQDRVAAAGRFENTLDGSSPLGEEEPLLHRPTSRKMSHLPSLKGSIAGVYSLCGGAGILLLTKLGGLLFDVLSPGSPFYFMAGFNAILLISGTLWGLGSFFQLKFENSL